MRKSEGDTQNKRTLAPGLALGCDQAVAIFKRWEMREKRGRLQYMFYKTTRDKHPCEKPKAENKKKRKISKAPTHRQEKINRSCQESINKPIIKVMTKSKSRKRGSAKKQGKENSKDNWRGPREQASEVSPAKIRNKDKTQVQS